MSCCVHEFLTVKVRVSVLNTVGRAFSFAETVIVYGEPLAIVVSVEELTTIEKVYKEESPLGDIEMKLPSVVVTSKFPVFLTM